MKPFLCPSSSVSLWLPLVLFISINVPRSLYADNQQFASCSNEAISCGGVRNISYPFWGLNREKYCGRPELEVKCEDNTTPTLNISSVKYRILDWNQDQKNLSLARDDFWDSTCPDSNENTTFDMTMFNYTGDIRNMTLLYQCAANFLSTIAELPSKQCTLKGGISTQVYATTDPPNFNAIGLCQNVIVIPILGSQVPAVESNDIDSAIKHGFQLEWILDNEECNTCSDSGGQCGNDNGQFTCFCKDGPHGRSCSESKSHGTVIGIAVGVAGFLGILLVCLLFLVLRRRKRIAEESKKKELFEHPSSGAGATSTTNMSKSVPSYASSNVGSLPKSFDYGVPVFNYTELEEATDNFNPTKELGDGGFGVVYYGKLKDGRAVAVKRLYESNFKVVEQFKNEVEILAKLRHTNLVALYGCTSRHSRELLLVYEYIPNGTVADHVHGNRAKSAILPWPIRLNIAVETAQALAYLHASDVIHRDVKTNNILLDNKFRVKVADFGLSRLFPNNVTHVSTAPQGTPGYVDPEYYQCYQLTDKSDVYSFGVVLIELISSLQAVDVNRTRLDVNLANMAVNKIQNRELVELVDPYLGFERDPAIRGMITAVAELAFRCLQQDRDIRPSMNEVLDVLRGIQNEEYSQQDSEVVDIWADEVIPLKKFPPPISPDSVADRWVSSSTTSNSS